MSEVSSPSDSDEQFEMVEEETEMSPMKDAPSSSDNGSTRQLVTLATEREDANIQEVIDKIREEEKEEEEVEMEVEEDTVVLSEHELSVIRLVELRLELHEWAEVREATIAKLREIADYIDTVSHRTGMARVVSSGGGALAGVLTVVGGALTLATMGAALPVLLAGTGLGLTFGLAGGAASITEKVLKSGQMAAAEEALNRDKEVSLKLEQAVEMLKKDEYLARQVAKQAVLSGAGAASNSAQLAGLLSAGGASGFGQIGAEAAAKIFGEDVGKEISKVLLHASGRILSGTVTVVLGGVTMMYDVYKLNSEVREMAKLGQEGVSEIRTIADQLEAALRDFCQKVEEKKEEVKAMVTPPDVPCNTPKAVDEPL